MRIFQWYKRFSEGRESTEDDQCPGRPVTVWTPQIDVTGSIVLPSGVKMVVPGDNVLISVSLRGVGI
ncbi:MAG: hypothetical protein ACTS4X_01865 [Candidatus Hodgkinia cicadicola]